MVVKVILHQGILGTAPGPGPCAATGRRPQGHAAQTIVTARKLNVPSGVIAAPVGQAIATLKPTAAVLSFRRLRPPPVPAARPMHAGFP